MVDCKINTIEGNNATELLAYGLDAQHISGRRRRGASYLGRYGSVPRRGHRGPFFFAHPSRRGERAALDQCVLVANAQCHPSWEHEDHEHEQHAIQDSRLDRIKLDHLGKEEHDGGADDWTQHRARSPQQQNENQLNARERTEDLRGDVMEMIRIEQTGHAGEGPADREDQHLVIQRVDAERLR